MEYSPSNEDIPAKLLHLRGLFALDGFGLSDTLLDRRRWGAQAATAADRAAVRGDTRGFTGKWAGR